jgi:tubulin-specific chaperone A
MAKTITDEKIKLSIIVDGNPAQKELHDLEKAVRDLNSQQKELRKEKQLLEKQGLKDTERYRAVSAAMRDNTQAIAANKIKMSELQKEIGLTGLTMTQLRQKATILRATLSNLVPGSAYYKRYEAELLAVSNRINQLRGNAQQARFSLGSMADSFNRYSGLAISAVAALTGLAFSLQKIIDINGKLADSQADVMKTTGMNKKEVDELTKSFGALETRTSRIDLLKIAEQGGRLGVPKAEIQDFVKSMNIAAVALGDSFTGGVDEVAEKLGKIKFLFKETKDAKIETAYSAIGSAINELGANGVASEANIAEFTKRIGSLTDVLKPTVQETLALGAAFEESGIEAETSSRAYNIFMKQASTEAEKFGKVMGIPKKAVEDMINTNPLNFMLEFSKGLNGMNATEVANTLDYLGVNADGANKVIGAMGNNFDRFNELINLSNTAFASGTSLISEYNVKNENLAATLEKVSKKISGWFSSETFNNWLFDLVSGFAKLIGATEDADNTGQKWRNTLLFTAKVIAIVISAMATSVGWQKLVALWTTRNTEATLLYSIASKARAVADAIVIISTQAVAAAQMLLTGNVVGATQAFRVMTATMMTTPWGFILGAIAAIGTAYVMFSENAEKATSAQDVLARTSRDVKGELDKQTATFFSLIAVINDAKASTEAKTAALEKAKEIGGEYTKGLTLENIATFEGKKAIDNYIKSLEKKITLQVLEAEQRRLIEEMQERKKKGLEEEVGIWDKIWTGVKNMGSVAGTSADIVILASTRKQKALADLQNQLKLTNDQMTEYLKANPDVITNIETNIKSDYVVPGKEDKKTGTKDKKIKSLEELYAIELDYKSRQNEALLKLERQRQDDEIALMDDGALKQETIENNRYKREIEDLLRSKVTADEMAKLDKDIAKAKADGDTRYYDFLNNLKKEWQIKNQDIDAKANQVAEGKFKIHLQNLGTIQEKAAKTQIELDKENFERAKTTRETAFQLQLAALGNNQKAKDQLTREHNLQELQIEEEFLKELIAKFNDIIGSGSFGGIDLELLSPDQVDAFTQMAEKLGLELAQLADKKNALTGQNNAQDSLDLGVANTSADILGFTSENWDMFFGNLEKGKLGINEIAFAVSALTSAYSMYSDFLAANENNQLKTYTRNSDAKKRKLKQQLDAGVINQNQYKKGVEKVDDDIEKKKADIEYKQAKRQKVIAAMNIINSTAQAIIGIWAQFPKFDFGATAAVMSGVVGALGALQLATVLKQPLPSRGAEDGLYNPDYVKRSQDGKLFRNSGTQKMKSGLFNRPTLLVGEAGGTMPEMVIDSKSFSRISPAVKDALIRELNGVRGFEKGFYDNVGNYQVPKETPSNNSNDELLKMMMGLIAENTTVMRELKDKQFVGIMTNKDLRSMKYLNDGLKDAKELENKAKK